MARSLQYLLALGLAVGGWQAAATWGPGLLAGAEAAGWVVTDPRYLWALMVVPLFIVVRAHTLSDLPRVQQALSLVLRGGFVAALALALVGVEKVEPRPVRTATVFVVDVSESMPDEALAAARERVEQAWRRRGEHVVRLVTFAGQAREVALGVKAGGSPGEAPAPGVPPLARFEGEAGAATDLQRALHLAFSLLPDDALARVVVMSDGLETQGSAEAEAETAARFGIPLHWVDLGELPRPPELMVVGLELPEAPRPNIPFTVTAKVRATRAMAGQCELTVDGLIEATRELDLAVGDADVALEVKVKEGGDKRVAVACAPVDPALDRFASNNRFELPLRVPDKPKVLYVEGEQRFRQNLVTALAEDFAVELRGARGVPSTLADANAFDLIFISDVPRQGEMGYENLSAQQMRVLEGYARGGGGLIFAGGENAFGPGGYGGTHLERKVLPVLLDVQKKEDIPGLALMLVIDRSGSMAQQNRMELAKEAARATLEALQPSDKLGVIAFDTVPTPVVRLQRASNRLRITDAIRAISPGGGTAIFPALDQAYEQLAATQAKIKHIILLSDGEANRTGILELVARSYQDRITISTVAAGTGSDTALLMQIAEEGGGRYYYTDRADNIPKLFLKETSEVSRRALVEDRFRPTVGKRFRGLQMFKGLQMDRVPPLLGYTSTRAKPRAEVIMTSHLGEPVLARWRLGLGKVLVWTSDVKNKWAHYWLSWPGYAQLWRQVIRDTMRSETEDPTYQMVAEVDRGRLVVGVDAVDEQDRFIDGLDSRVTVIAPDGAETQVPLRQTAAGRYEGELKLAQFGPYTVRGEHAPKADPDARHRSFATVAWPYPTEHAGGAPDTAVLRHLAERTGGRVDPSPAHLFDAGGATVDERTPQWHLPLYLALVLLVLDVLLRRVRLYGRTRLRWDQVRG